MSKDERPEWFAHEVRILWVDRPEERSVIRLPETSTPRFYSALRDAVEAIVSRPFEHVRVFTSFEPGGEPGYTCMFVNENGHLVGLARNEVATQVYRNNVLVHEVPPPSPEDLPWIAGPAVLFKRRVWF